MERSQIKFSKDLEIMLMHSKYLEGKKTRITVAGIYNQENATLSLGVAKCFREDNFCRKTGRELAIGRLDILGNRPTLRIIVEPEADIQEVFKNKFNQIETFLQREGLKKLNASLEEGGLDNRIGAEKAYKSVEKILKLESEIS